MTKEEKILLQAAAVHALKRIDWNLDSCKGGAFVKIEIYGTPKPLGIGLGDHAPHFYLPADFEDERRVKAIIEDEVNGAVKELLRRVRIRLQAIVDEDDKPAPAGR